MKWGLVRAPHKAVLQSKGAGDDRGKAGPAHIIPCKQQGPRIHHTACLQKRTAWGCRWREEQATVVAVRAGTTAQGARHPPAHTACTHLKEAGGVQECAGRARTPAGCSRHRHCVLAVQCVATVGKSVQNHKLKLSMYTQGTVM